METYDPPRSLTSPIDLCAALDAAVTAAHAGAAILQSYAHHRADLVIDRKARNDLVSQADREAEAAIIDELQARTPKFGIVAEETGGQAQGAATWYIDPLDGTTNFLHGIPQFAISIGLAREGQVIAGVIYNPGNDELYMAEKGAGAFLNDTRLRVSGRLQLHDCVIACGLPHIGRGDFEQSRNEMAALQPKVAGLRRFGAASLDMAFVAAGRLDGYWERNLQPWDVAAGIIMIKEAGGLVSDIDGGDVLKTGDVVCGNEMVHNSLVKILRPLSRK